jgi:hypothetical protein
MIGLNFISGFSVSLLLNMEGLATAIIAVFFFRENTGKRLWFSLLCMTVAGVFLSWNPNQSKFNVAGPLLILLAAVCWGIDNNLTRQISDKNPVQITYIKGLVGGLISLLAVLILGKSLSWDYGLPLALMLGAGCDELWHQSCIYYQSVSRFGFLKNRSVLYSGAICRRCRFDYYTKGLDWLGNVSGNGVNGSRRLAHQQ